MKKVMTLVAVFLLLLMACGGPDISKKEAINRAYSYIHKYCDENSVFASAPKSDYRISNESMFGYSIRIAKEPVGNEPYRRSVGTGSATSVLMTLPTRKSSIYYGLVRFHLDGNIVSNGYYTDELDKYCGLGWFDGYTSVYEMIRPTGNNEPIPADELRMK